MAKRSSGPTAPRQLDPAQAAEWRDARKQLAGDLDAVRLQQLEAYAIARARWLEAEAFLREHGSVLRLRNDKGDVKAVQEAPELKIAERSQDRTLKLARMLGIGLLA